MRCSGLRNLIELMSMIECVSMVFYLEARYLKSA